MTTRKILFLTNEKKPISWAAYSIVDETGKKIISGETKHEGTTGLFSTSESNIVASIVYKKKKFNITINLINSNSTRSIITVIAPVSVNVTLKESDPVISNQYPDKTFNPLYFQKRHIVQQGETIDKIVDQYAPKNKFPVSHQTLFDANYIDMANQAKYGWKKWAEIRKPDGSLKAGATVYLPINFARPGERVLNMPWSINELPNRNGNYTTIIMAKTFNIYIKAPDNREETTSAFLKDNKGNNVFEFKVLLRGTQRNRLEEKGDTPLGVYRILGLEATPSADEYGPNNILRISPLLGEAMRSNNRDRTGKVTNTRTSLLIHGGRQTSRYWRNGKPYLRNTFGCVRAFDTDMATLKTKIQELQNNKLGFGLTIITNINDKIDS